MISVPRTAVDQAVCQRAHHFSTPLSHCNIYAVEYQRGTLHTYTMEQIQGTFIGCMTCRLGILTQGVLLSIVHTEPGPGTTLSYCSLHSLSAQFSEQVSRQRATCRHIAYPKYIDSTLKPTTFSNLMERISNLSFLTFLTSAGMFNQKLGTK